MTTNQDQESVRLASCKDPLKSMKRAYRKCGFAFFALSLFLTLLVPVLFFLVSLLEQHGIGISAVFNEYLLFFNEAIILLAILVGALFLIGLPKSAPERRPVSFKLVAVLFPIAVAFGTVGSIVSNFWTSLWDMIVGVQVEDTLTEAMTATTVWQMVICVGILAPIIEEFFFRKLLIDRLHTHSEPIAILTSGLFFALFHGNLNQFFYTFGIGLLLAYLYCKTGSYLTVVLFHSAFNFFSGIIPLLLSQAVVSVENGIDALPLYEQLSLISTSRLSLLYVFISMGVSVLGIVFFIRFVKRAKFTKTPDILTPEQRAKATLLNVGIIAACALNLFILIRSLL